MNPERILSLDVSTKTGYAVAISSDSGMALEDYGTIPQIHKPDGDYPGVFIDWSNLCFDEIKKLIDKFRPDVIVVEETSKGSKNAMSQKILEYIHYLLAKFIKESGIKSVYILTEQWRREIGCQMNDKEKLRNKEVRAYKKKHKTNIAYDINEKRTGLIGRKHVNIRRVSEIFEGQLREPLKRKDEDLADGLGLLACYYLRRLNKTDKVQEMTLEEIIKDKL
jgi:Holliday junction resolvasome RuvABC endonuclease subunit